MIRSIFDKARNLYSSRLESYRENRILEHVKIAKPGIVDEKLRRLLDDMIESRPWLAEHFSPTIIDFVNKPSMRKTDGGSDFFYGYVDHMLEKRTAPPQRYTFSGPSGRKYEAS